jgi:hypothetical protein
MKKLWIVLIILLTAGCAGTGGMRSSGYSSGASGSGDSATDPYRPNMGSEPGSQQFAPFKGMDSSFQPYYGG